MSKASVTNSDLETYHKPGLALMFSYLPGLELGKMKPDLPLGKFESESEVTQSCPTLRPRGL